MLKIDYMVLSLHSSEWYTAFLPSAHQKLSFRGWGGSLDLEVLRHVKVHIAAIHLRVAKVYDFEKVLHWLPKNVKTIFPGTTSQKLESLKYEIGRDTFISA